LTINASGDTLRADSLRGGALKMKPLRPLVFAVALTSAGCIHTDDPDAEQSATTSSVALGLRRAVCINGPSYYGGIDPSAVDAVVAIEGLGPMTDEPAQAPTRLAAALAESRSKRGKQPPIHADLEAAATRLAQGVMRLSLPAARILCARGLVAVDGGVRWRADPRLRWQSRLRLVEAQVIAFLSAIVAPVLFVRAQEGFFFVDGEPLRRRMDCVASLSTVSLPGGHHLHLDAPEPVADAVAAFLAGV
jgi:pimeloyl-ACP methyl ester carboxylesterase